MNAINRNQCPVCGSSEITVSLPEARDYITGEKFEVLRCGNCEVRFTYPRPESMDPYYPKAYRKYNPLVLEVLKTLYHFQVNRWRKLFPKPGSALEMGCGDGLMLDALRNKGWKVIGTERTQKMAEFARDNLGLEVYVGGLEALPHRQKFDLIILFQVLEHLDNPVLVLRQCADLLALDGKLIIAVPNSNSWQSRYASSGWFHLDVPRHLFHFSPTSLQKALSLAGLGISSISYVSFEHDPFGWIQSLLNRHLHDGNGLTRLLMNLDRFRLGHSTSILLSGVLLVPSMFASLISWIFKYGAIMQVVSTHTNDATQGGARKDAPYA